MIEIATSPLGSIFIASLPATLAKCANYCCSNSLGFFLIEGAPPKGGAPSLLTKSMHHSNLVKQERSPFLYLPQVVIPTP